MKSVLLIILLIPALLFSQGKLDKAKKNLSQKSTGTTTQGTTLISSGSSNTNTTATKSDNYWLYAFAKLAFLGSFKLVFGNFEQRNFTPYPYYKGNFGEYSKIATKNLKKQQWQVGTNYFIGKTIKGITATVNYRFSPMLGVTISQSHFYQKEQPAKKADHYNNYFDVTSVMANYYRIREKSITIWWGIGASYVANEVKKIGFSYTIGTTVYLFRPISVLLFWKQSLINGETLDKLELRANYHLKRWAIFGGYHNYNFAYQPFDGGFFGLSYTF